MKTKKKGVSPVVSTILLIMIVIILALIILLWVTSFVREAITKKINTDEKAVEQWCKEISITPELSDDSVQFGFTNNGNVPIYKYELKLIEKTGDSKTILIDPPHGGSVNPGYSSIIDSEDSSISSLGINSYSQYEKIKIIPFLLGKGKKSSGKIEFKCPETDNFII
jgi:flagellin-like protein